MLKEHIGESMLRYSSFGTRIDDASGKDKWQRNITAAHNVSQANGQV